MKLSTFARILRITCLVTACLICQNEKIKYSPELDPNLSTLQSHFIPLDYNIHLYPIFLL